MYKVVHRFADAQDKNYIYEVGDTYPREGIKPTKARIEELASNKNAAGKVLIEEVEIVSEEETESKEEAEPEEEATSEVETEPEEAKPKK